MHIRLFLVVLILSALFVMPAAGETEGVVHLPIFGITIIPGDFNHAIFDNSALLTLEFSDFELPISDEAKDTLRIIKLIIFMIIGIFASNRITRLYFRRKLSENPKSRHMQILSYLNEHPGVSETDIVNTTGFSRGSVSYNLRRLQQENKVSKISSLYYPSDISPSETIVKAEKVLGNKKRQRIFQIILENPGISQKQLADEMQIPLSTLRWHLGKLADANLIQIEAKQHTLCYSVNPDFSKQDE